MSNYKSQTIIINNNSNNYNNLIEFTQNHINTFGSKQSLIKDVNVIDDFIKFILNTKKFKHSIIDSLPYKYSREEMFILIHYYLQQIVYLGYHHNSISSYTSTFKRFFLYLYPNQGLITNIFAIKRHDWIIQDSDKSKIVYLLKQGFNYNKEDVIVKLIVRLAWELYIPIKHLINLRLKKENPLVVSIKFNVNSPKTSISFNKSCNNSTTQLYSCYKKLKTDSCNNYLFENDVNQQKINNFLTKYLIKYNIEPITLKNIQNIRLEEFLYKNNILFLKC